MHIIDEADEEDLVIHGRVNLNTADAGMIEEIENRAIEKLKEHYSWLMEQFTGLKISLNETNFKEGWIEYSLEMKDDTVAVNVWKKDQGVGLVPTPESRVGADIY